VSGINGTELTRDLDIREENCREKYGRNASRREGKKEVNAIKMKEK